MDLNGAPHPEEAYTLRNISRHDEIEKWISPRVGMRISRTIAGGFGTVYCVFTVRHKQLMAIIVVRSKHRECIPSLNASTHYLLAVCAESVSWNWVFWCCH